MTSARLIAGLLLATVPSACGSRSQGAGLVWLNPQVEDRCDELESVRAAETPGGRLPKHFPLPQGAEIAGTAPGDPPTVHVTAPGGFLALDSFFKSELQSRGWNDGSSGNGSDPGGRYGSVDVNGRGYRGEVWVIECGDDDPEILVEIAPGGRGP
jgi:hypothetical protein